jgi:hypothetical protein
MVAERVGFPATHARSRAFDEVHGHMLMLSDALSAGIGKQFPEKFGAPSTSPAGH